MNFDCHSHHNVKYCTLVNIVKTKIHTAVYKYKRLCTGTCAGACSDTCTSDGRKYDELAGLGGIRATCVDDNYMCTDDDPYGHTDNILVHEFSHTIHQYALPHVPGDWWDKVFKISNIIILVPFC